MKAGGKKSKRMKAEREEKKSELWKGSEGGKRKKIETVIMKGGNIFNKGKKEILRV